jgi:hypothetical protein
MLLAFLHFLLLLAILATTWMLLIVLVVLAFVKRSEGAVENIQDNLFPIFCLKLGFLLQNTEDERVWHDAVAESRANREYTRFVNVVVHKETVEWRIGRHCGCNNDSDCRTRYANPRI